jgi:hypothetical protein
VIQVKKLSKAKISEALRKEGVPESAIDYFAKPLSNARSDLHPCIEAWIAGEKQDFIFTSPVTGESVSLFELDIPFLCGRTAHYSLYLYFMNDLLKNPNDKLKFKSVKNFHNMPTQ